MRVFICSDDDDAPFVRELMSVLRDQGYKVLRWNHLLSPDKWQRDIEFCAVLLYILSDASRHSENCNAQWQYALTLDKPIITLKLEDVELPEILRHQNLIDYLDFVEIGRQITDGVPTLTKDRYASQVTMKMLIVELADIKRNLPDLPETAPLNPALLATDPHEETQKLPDEPKPDPLRQAWRSHVNKRLRRILGKED